MAHMVVGCHDEASVHKRHDHVEIAPRMLAEPVHELHDALRLACGDINPADNLVALVR